MPNLLVGLLNEWDNLGLESFCSVNRGHWVHKLQTAYWKRMYLQDHIGTKNAVERTTTHPQATLVETARRLDTYRLSGTRKMSVPRFYNKLKQEDQTVIWRGPCSNNSHSGGSRQRTSDTQLGQPPAQRWRITVDSVQEQAIQLPRNIRHQERYLLQQQQQRFQRFLNSRPRDFSTVVQRVPVITDPRQHPDAVLDPAVRARNLQMAFQPRVELTGIENEARPYVTNREWIDEEEEQHIDAEYATV